MWIAGLIGWAVLYPFFMWDYMFSLPLMMVFAFAAGPILGAASQRARCRRCGLELDGSYERSLMEGVVTPDVSSAPRVILGRQSVEAGTPIRGRLVVASSRPLRSAYVRVRSRIAPIEGGARREIVGPRIPVGADGRFVLTAPRHPVSGVGDLVCVSHRVEAAVLYRRGPRDVAATTIEVQPRTVEARRRQHPDPGYRAAAVPPVAARGLFDGLLPSDVPELLTERQLGRHLASLWAEGMSVRPGRKQRRRFAAALSTSILAAGAASAAVLPLPIGAGPIVVLAAAILSLMAWDHFRPRRVAIDVPFERCHVRVRVSQAVALADAVHVRVDVPEGAADEYRAELVRREHVDGRDVSAPPRDSLRRIPQSFSEREDGQLETWVTLPADEMPTLVDADHHSVRWSVQVRRGEELVAEHPVCVLPVRLKAG